MAKKKVKVPTNITPEHQEAFNALTSGKFDSFALFSAFLNGEPTSVIVNIYRTNANTKDYLITPLFVAVTPNMKLTDHDGKEPNYVG